MSMTFEHESEEQLKSTILAIFKKYLDLEKYQVFFFGSRVTGRGDERSDIDVGILGTTAVPPDVLSEIRGEIEDLSILYTVDVVDFFNLPDAFKEVALLHTERIQEHYV